MEPAPYPAYTSLKRLAWLVFSDADPCCPGVWAMDDNVSEKRNKKAGMSLFFSIRCEV